MPQEVRVPDIGDFDAVEIVEVFVAEGDAVQKDDPLVLLESDKATMEVPAPAGGVVSALKISSGDKVAEGDLLLLLEMEEQEAEQKTSTPADQPPEQAEPAPPEVPADGAESPVAPADPEPVEDLPSPAAQPVSGSLPHASPAVRLLARELGVDLTRVTGSGPKGRILKGDVQQFVKQALRAPVPASPVASGSSGLPPIPAIDFSKFGEIEEKPLSRIRKLSAAHLHRSWVNVPHVTQFESTDITSLESFRRSESDRLGVKLTLLPFLIRAVAGALQKFPEFNSSLAPGGEHLIIKKYINIGFAADTEHGLVVPVIRDADKKGIVELARDTAELAGKARDRKLGPDDLAGGCFSISSLGGIGGSHFTPIVNAPEVAILGVSRARMEPFWDGSAFEPRLMLPLSLSYDHRVIDGAAAARFVVYLGDVLADVRRLLL